MKDFDRAREDLQRWRADQPADPFGADTALVAMLRSHLGTGARWDALAGRAGAFGHAVVDVVAPATQRSEHRDHLPELRRWDGSGQRVEAVSFDGEYHRIGRVVWGSGVVADSATPGTAFEQATLLYLLSAEGEAGHACPAVCTIGLARALRRKGDAEVSSRFLPPLVERDYDRAERASQFLTEVQGGSDVGANATVARPAGDGSYLVHGEKWFCSVADAGQFLLTARVEGAGDGTRGLGCFVMPRMLAGGPNGFAIRRLKDKLGTRGMASAEIDLDGARAWPIGPVEEGFRTAVGVVLNTSRWMTAVGATGMMRRAWLEASAYARHRRAFGTTIERFPAVRATLAGMRARWLSALFATGALTALEDRIDAGTATDDDEALHRLLVNVLKYAATRAATEVVRDAIEVFGGNGTIEDFSVLPRLYRDALVYESWEGTHNVLCAQVQRDATRLDLAGALERHLASRLGGTNATPGAAATAEALGASAAAEVAGLRRAVTDATFGALHLRAHLGRIADAVGAAELLAAHRGAPGAGLDAAAAWLVRTRLAPAYRPEDDPGYADLVEAALAGTA